MARQVLLAKPTGKRSRGRPRTRWSDYISDLSWSRPGVDAVVISDHHVSMVELTTIVVACCAIELSNIKSNTSKSSIRHVG